eukprot:4346861-Alexandrium_andersonii.AAC.1
MRTPSRQHSAGDPWLTHHKRYLRPAPRFGKELGCCGPGVALSGWARFIEGPCQRDQHAENHMKRI